MYIRTSHSASTHAHFLVQCVSQWSYKPRKMLKNITICVTNISILVETLQQFCQFNTNPTMATGTLANKSM